MIQRYEPYLSLCDYTGENDADMRKCNHGDWVRYEGHTKTVLELEKAHERIKELEEELGKYKNV